MPEQDFELYLSLLSRFLRLKSAQRGEIADELRDHLEARLEELAARGLTRDEAIRAALDEFGDAAELANHFTQVAHIRNRRLIMRVTFGTISALAALLLVTAAFSPESRQAPAPSIVIAQETPAASPTKKRLEPAATTADDGKTATEAKLSKMLDKLPDGLDNAPFAMAIERLGDLLDVDILIDQAAITEANIETNAIVSLNVRRTKLTGRMALDLILEPLKLSYTIRDGLIMVTTVENANQIQVYNVRDLLFNLGEQAGSGGAAPGAGMPGAMGGGMGSMMKPGMGGGMAGMGGMGLGGGFPVTRETKSLAVLIATTIDPDSWSPVSVIGDDPTGRQGSIMQYHELLVVKNSQTVHGKIKALLEMMRTSAKMPFGAATPGGPAPAGR